MKINSDALVSMTEANQNFSRVARLVDQNGSVIVLKNNAPKYLIIEYSKVEEEQFASDEEVERISRRLLEKHRKAYEELAK